MDRAIKALAWYTAIYVFISLIVGIFLIGQSVVWTPLMQAGAVGTGLPTIALAILVLIRIRRRDSIKLS